MNRHQKLNKNQEKLVSKATVTLMSVLLDS